MRGIDLRVDIENLLLKLKPFSKNPYAFTRMRRVKDDIMCCCPFHIDSRPSFGIMIEPPYYYHCFGCDEKGDLINLIEKLTGENYVKAFLALGVEVERGKYKIDLSKYFADDEEKEYSKQIYKVNSKYPLYLIKERGLSVRALKKYEVIYDKGKIIFPVRDHEGYIRFYKSRDILDKNYMNEKGIEKSDVIYGLYYLINSPKSIKEIYLVEGELDTISCYEAKLPAGAVMGSEVFKKQLDLLLKYGFKTINLFFDNDEKGKKCILETYQKILKYKYPFKVNVVIYPSSAKDPNELLVTKMIGKIKLVSAEKYFLAETNKSLF